MDKISVTVVGDNRVDLVHRLRAFADNLDGSPADASGKVTAKAKTKTTSKAAAAAPAVDEEDDDFKADTGEANGFDDAEGEDDGAGFMETTGAQGNGTGKAAGKTKAKPKKITLDDVNDACKAHAQAKGRPATLAVLEKKFKTQSVTALKPEQYEQCISAMTVN